MDIWHLDLRGAAQHQRADWALLDDQERGRCLRLRGPLLRGRYIAAHAGLRRVLAAQLGCHPKALTLAREPGGRPVLRGVRTKAAKPSAQDTLHFSLAHAGDHALVGLSEQYPLGVDIEQLPAPADLAQDLAPHLSGLEQADLARQPPPGRPAEALRLWVCKEALLKATGWGLALAPAALSLQTRPTPRLVHSSRHGILPYDWHLALHEAPGAWVAALAWAGPRDVAPRWAEWARPDAEGPSP